MVKSKVESSKPHKKIKDVSCIVLLSGGIDSTACVHYYLNQRFNTGALFVDYGQLPIKREEQSAKQIASYYDIKLDIVRLHPTKYHEYGETKGRNAFFILTALLFYPKHVGIISLGIHSGTPYYDCSESFVKDISKILNGYTDGRVNLDAPFLKWNKKMIYEYCKDNDVPVHLTYSCENSGDKPCGRCRSCLDRGTLNVSKKA